MLYAISHFLFKNRSPIKRCGRNELEVKGSADFVVLFVQHVIKSAENVDWLIENDAVTNWGSSI